MNDLVRNPDGKVSESKVWANVGKAICVYLILAYTNAVLTTEYTLLTLLLFIIAPDLVKKIVTMRFGTPPQGAK